MIAALMTGLLVVEGVGWLAVASAISSMAGWPDALVPVVAAALYLGLRLALVLLSFAISRWARGAPWTPMSAAGWFRCIVGEWLAIVHHHLVALPFHRLLPAPAAARRAAPGKRAAAIAEPAAQPLPVLFVHGLWNNAGIWRPLLARLCGRVRARLFTLTYGPPWSSIDAFADQLAARVEAICRETGAARLVLVGHSMGGLVARGYLRRHGSARVAKLVTVATPHRGSALAHLAGGACGRELRPASEWLASWDALPRVDVPCVSVYSLHDNLVSPQDSPELPGASWRALPGLGHNAINYSREVARIVAAEIDVPAAAAAGPSA